MIRLLATLLVLAAPGVALAQNTVVKTGNICTETWTSDNTYILQSRVFVTGTDCVLTIEPGTVIKGRFNADPLQAAVLVVTRGAQIMADGEREDGTIDPIIFTAEEDDLSTPGDLRNTDRARWGGVVILGNARINVAGGVENIEGLDATDPRGQYGGDDDDDDSGVFRYVSIRHGGTSIGNNNELNGLSMGGVGRGTTIEYVETFAIADDGFEWFGGTVDTKYLVSAFNDDDAFDWDEGFRGKGQFWFAIHASDRAGSGGEFDGGTTPEDGTPFTIPTVYNATFIGAGPTGPTSNDFALSIDDNSGGKFYNSIFTGFTGGAITIEDASSGEDTFARFTAGDLVLENNLFFGFGTGDAIDQAVAVSGSGATDATTQQFRTYVSANNQFVDPQLGGISRTFDQGLDPRPQTDGPAATSGADEPEGDDFFTDVDYLGAFAPEGAVWATGWTILDEGLYLSGMATPAEGSPLETLSFAVGPNPTRGNATLRFTLDRAQDVRIALYDVLGREVAVVAEGAFPAGEQTARVAAGDLPAGVYVLRLQGEGASAVRQISVVR